MPNNSKMVKERAIPFLTNNWHGSYSPVGRDRRVGP